MNIYDKVSDVVVNLSVKVSGILTCHRILLRMVFQDWVGSWKQTGSGSGRSLEIYYRVFRAIFLLSVISRISWVFPSNSGYIGYHLYFWSENLF